MRNRSGLTLIETLIALFVFGVVAAIATTGVINSLRVQSTNEAATSAQAKLRRITEVFTQELRSAVLGGVTNAPYPSGPNQISFLLLDGGAGYQVLPHDSGNNYSFVNSSNVQISSGASLSAVEADLVDNEVLMVNGNGDAVLLHITNISERGHNTGIYNLVHPACANTIDYTPNTLILNVRSVGFALGADGTLYQRSGTAAPVPVAFDLDAMGLEYVYEEDDGTPHLLDSPLTEAGVPVRTATHAGASVALARVQLTVAASEPSMGGRMVSRSYSGQVEMSSNRSFEITRVVDCD